MNRIQRIAAPVRGQLEGHLRLAIEKGELAPGSRLVEREICEAFGVSRPLVREALRRLESEGLARPLPLGGLAVTVMNLEEAMQIYAVRKELEGLAATLFVESASSEDRDLLRQTVNELTAAHRAGDGDKLLDAKSVFYQILARGSNNDVLQNMLDNLHGRIRLLRGTSLAMPGRTECMVQELTKIAQAIFEGDSKKARSTTEQHVENAMTATRSALS